MSSERLLLAFIFLILVHFLASVKSQPICLNNGNYTRNSTYWANLNTALSSVFTNVDSNGFYGASIGQDPDRANAIVLCRGDVLLDECRQCVRNATAELLQSCPNQKQAITWFEICMLRYSDEGIYGTLATSPGYWLWNPNNATNPVQFEGDLRTLIDNLRDQAANGGSLRKMAAGNISDPSSQTIFSLVQCTPDLSAEDCSECLIGATADIPRCCDRKRGGRVLWPSCNLRFEIYPFYNETRLQELEAVPVPAPAPAPEQVLGPPILPTPPGKVDSNRTGTVIIIVVSVAVSVIVAVSIGILIRKRTKQKLKEKFETEDEISFQSLQYDFSTIRAATNDFSDDKKLGQGGFGTVYWGKLPNGQEIAVKRLSKNSGQGDQEFKNEVLLLARLQHKNLVRLLGFSLEGREKLLVYEFLENASLDHFIFDPIKRTYLNWNTRLKIIGAIARGILYLHEDSLLKIIHRDLKASNVLLDGDMHPKIADFGMARLFGRDESQASTSIIAGTYGYMAPEYAARGQFSIKSDVYSFGVLVLEIISGKSNHNFSIGDDAEDLLSFAWRNWRKGTAANVVDPFLRAGGGSISEIQRCIHVGLLCVQANAADRPTMASVVLMLSSISLTLPVPSEPAYYASSARSSDVLPLQPECNSSPESHEPPHESDPSSRNDDSITQLYPR